MNYKKIITAALLCVVFTTNAFASIMGNLSDSKNTNFGAGSVLYSNSFVNGEKKQQEFYVDYIPNTEAVPVVLNGEQIYGKRTIKQAAKYYDDLNYRPLIGINADYFSFKTGVPMGHTISGGELITKDTTGQNAIGFRADGTAFISWLEIQSKLVSENGTSMSIDCINKWCYSGAVVSYFMSDYFGKDTKTSGKCRYVIFSKVSGNIRIGEEAVLKVEDKFDADINIAIPEDRYVLAMDLTTGNPAQLEFMNNLYIGQTLTMKNEAVYDKELWREAENGLGSVGGRLIEKGEVYTNFEKGTAPRTAVGIRADGKIIFYVVDGRQSGYSTGLSMKDLAQRMYELGCTDAINLDGGGSTAIAGVYPGSDTFEVINKPSEGVLRSCANYIFLQDMRKPTGVPQDINIKNPQNANYLTGKKVKIELGEMWDTHNFKIDASAATYELENGDGASSVIDGDTVALYGNGKTRVKVSIGGNTKTLSMNVYDFPDEIRFTNAGEYNLSSVNLNMGENYSVDLACDVFLNGYKLARDEENVTYVVEGDIGRMDGTVFTANTSAEGTGRIAIHAGQLVKFVTVNVSGGSKFADLNSHWAKNAINTLYDKGMVSGEQNNGVWYYYPDNHMTRIEFSSLVCKYLGVDVTQYADKELVYSDKADLAPWMLNYAKAVSDLGLINGIDGAFKPNDRLTRAQAATIIGRMIPEEENLPSLNFSDTGNIPQWARQYFAKLIKNGLLKGYEDNTLKPERNVTRAEAGGIIFNLLVDQNQV